MLNVKSYEDYAREYLPKNAFDYYYSGADDMQTLQENSLAFKRIRIIPKILQDVRTIDTSTTILNNKINLPICFAPTAMQKMAHPDGESASAKASEKLNSCFILSSLSTTSIEKIANDAPNGLRWFQLYIYKDRNITRNLIERAISSGYKAIVLTVDTPMLGQREADIKNKFSLPSHLHLANFTSIGGKHAYGVKSTANEHIYNTKSSESIRSNVLTSGIAEYVDSLFDKGITWEDVQWLCKISNLPVIAKGILSVSDAILAIKMGCKAIIVSNHGARQLDGVPATIEVLEDIVDSVKKENENIEVYLDGGIRRGTDIFKALALGATAVFVGRPILWGLSYEGKDGVYNVVELLRKELEKAMMFAGANSIEKIKKDHVIKESYFRQAKL